MADMKAFRVVDGELGSEEYKQWFTCAILYGEDTIAWVKDKQSALMFCLIMNHISLMLNPDPPISPQSDNVQAD